MQLISFQFHKNCYANLIIFDFETYSYKIKKKILLFLNLKYESFIYIYELMKY